MNYIYLGLVLLTSFFSNAQEKAIFVQYKAVKGNIENTESLIATNKKALYITDSLFISNQDDDALTEINEMTNQIDIGQKTIKLDKMKYYSSRNESIIHFTQNYKGTPTLVKDSLPSLDWHINTTIKKKIGDFDCNKATTNFRGTQVVAWYSEDLNIPFGPWKFKGLPGIILEIYTVDEPMIHHWRATQVKYPFDTELRLDYQNDLEIVDYKEIVEEMEEHIKLQMQRMQSRVPQGVTSVNSKINRAGVEKIYEWEL